MDITEAYARKFLIGRGFDDPHFEPDGNVPPDFLLPNNTAVEVRKLNQILVDREDGVENLETAEIALRRAIQPVLEGFQTENPDQVTYGVFYQFRRPIPKKGVIERELRQALAEFLDGDRNTSIPVKLPCGIKLRFIEYQIWRDTQFRLGGYLDHETGGSVVERFEIALRHALCEKTEKVKKVQARYPVWWLVLVDHVTMGTDNSDRDQIKARSPFPHGFDKVFIVSPRSPDDYFEL